jgi:hypothetical protein
MIWFTCKQCGKRHGRAEHLSGTLVFCECGHGNRVPWSSTVPEPEPEEAPPLPPPPRPRAPRPSSEEELPGPEFLPPRRVREKRRPNPAYCLNHDETPKEAVCDACHCSFCSACVVTLQGQTLCGPCKNFRVRGLSRPARVPALSVVSLVLSLVSAPAAALLALLAVSVQLAGEGGLVMAEVMCVLGMLLPIAGLVLGWAALRQIESKPNLGGRSLAITGATTGLAGTLLCLAIAVLTIAKQWQG